MKRVFGGLLLGSAALLFAAACGSDSEGDKSCTCSCSCAGAAPTTLSGVANADQCRADCKASCSGEWDGKYDCS